jgi:glutamate carboxypeptidase
MASASQILFYMESQQSAMVELLKNLVAMETPSDDPASQQQIRLRLKQEFERRDYRVNLIPGRDSGGHVYATPAKGRNKMPAQLMLGHCDTV